VKPLAGPSLGDRIVEYDNLIALQAGLFVHPLEVQASTVESFFGPSQRTLPTDGTRVWSFAEKLREGVGPISRTPAWSIGAASPERLHPENLNASLKSRSFKNLSL
jgi:hypothetical protein